MPAWKRLWWHAIFVCLTATACDCSGAAKEPAPTAQSASATATPLAKAAPAKPQPAQDIAARDAGTGPLGAQSAQPAPHDPNQKHPPAGPGKVRVSGTVNVKPGGSAQTNSTQVCVYQHDDIPCVQTDNAGYFSMVVPANAEIALLFKGQGLRPTLRAFVTAEADISLGNSRVPNQQGLSGIAKALGTEEHPDKGGLFFSGIPGVTATLEPNSGQRFFLTYDNTLDEHAKGVPMHGSAGYVNVIPGRTALRFFHPDGPCRYSPQALSGWPSAADPGIAIVPVVAGHLTHMISMYCGK